jgi:hypothetical protein
MDYSPPAYSKQYYLHRAIEFGEPFGETLLYFDRTGVGKDMNFAIIFYPSQKIEDPMEVVNDVGATFDLPATMPIITSPVPDHVIQSIEKKIPVH